MKLIIVTLLVASSFKSNADLIGATQTFSDGETPTVSDGGSCFDCVVNGWVGEAALDAGQGGVGDHAVLYETDNSGFHFLTWQGYSPFEDAAFLGNLLAAGVTQIQFDARHTGIGADLFLRAFLFDPFDDGINFSESIDFAYSSFGASIQSTSTSWQTYSISLEPLSMIAGGFGSNNRTAGEILSNVVQFGLRHDPNGDGPSFPDHVTAGVYFDNLVLVTVPEPGTLVLFGAGLLGMAISRRKRRI